MTLVQEMILGETQIIVLYLNSYGKYQKNTTTHEIFDFAHSIAQDEQKFTYRGVNSKYIK